MRFFERAEVKNALAYLRLLAAPDDDGAFLRIVNFPPRGIGARTLEGLQDPARGAGRACGRPRRRQGDGQGGRESRRVRQADRSDATATAGLPLPEAVAHVNHASGLIAHYKAEKDGQDRLENLEELVNAADCVPARGRSRRRRAGGDGEADDAGGGRRRRRDRSAHRVSRPRRAGGGRHAGGGGPPALQLMTVHAAKGLEFHTVFVTGLEEGLFPHENSRRRGRRRRRGAAPHVRGDDPREAPSLPHAGPEPDAARPGALQHRVALSRRSCRRSWCSGFAAPARGR